MSLNCSSTLVSAARACTQDEQTQMLEASDLIIADMTQCSPVRCKPLGLFSSSWEQQRRVSCFWRLPADPGSCADPNFKQSMLEVPSLANLRLCFQDICAARSARVRSFKLLLEASRNLKIGWCCWKQRGSVLSGCKGGRQHAATVTSAQLIWHR